MSNFENYLQGRKDALNIIEQYIYFCSKHVYSEQELETLIDINNFILKLKQNENNTNSTDKEMVE